MWRHLFKLHRLVTLKSCISFDKTAFEFRQKVTCKLPLAINGEVIAKPGMPGEIIKVLNDDPKDVSYHVRFPGRTLLIPENALKPLEQEQSNEPEQASG